MSTTGSGNLIPLSPIVNQGNPYISGMRLTWLTTTTFSVGLGQVRDTSNVMDMIMGSTLFPSSGSGGTNNFMNNSAAVTVTITSSGAAGLDTGTLAASTLYSVFAIGDSRGFNNGSAVISLAAPGFTTASTNVLHLPLGYDSYRYIGSISTDGSSHVRKFVQTGAQAVRSMWYDNGTIATTPGIALSGTVAVSAAYVSTGTNLATLIPTTQLEVMLGVAWTPNGATDVLSLAPATIDNGTTVTIGALNIWESGVTGAIKQVLRVPANLSTAVPAVQQINYAISSAAGTIVFTVAGYVDQL